VRPGKRLVVWAGEKLVEVLWRAQCALQVCGGVMVL